MYLRGAQQALVASFNRCGTLCVALDGVRLQNAGALVVFAASMMDDHHSFGAMLPQQVLPELLVDRSRLQHPFRLKMGKGAKRRAAAGGGNALAKTFEVCRGLDNAIRSVLNEGIDQFKCDHIQVPSVGSDALLLDSLTAGPVPALHAEPLSLCLSVGQLGCLDNWGVSKLRDLEIEGSRN